MNTRLQLSFSLLTLALTMAGCSTLPFSQQPASKTPAARATAKAPVVDRSTRRSPTAQSPATSQVDVGQLPREDPLLPREYSSAYPSASDPYAAPARPYPPGQEGAYRQPTYPPTGNTTLPPVAGNNNRQPSYPPGPGNTTLPPVAGNNNRQPSYPPGAAAPYPPTSQPYPAPPNDGYGRTAPPPGSPAYPQGADTGYGAPAPVPGSLPEPQPVVPRAPHSTPAPRSAPNPAAVATAPSPSVEPAPAPAQPAAAPPPPAPPADLPPAEITREGNQAVVALLDSADKYVKSNQLDKAGAALERALRVEPRNAGIWHDLAQIRLHQGQYQQAESLASKSNNLASGNRALQARNWKVIASARKAAGNAAGAEEAEARAAQSR
ncbi:MAG: tetratricopeptide repeat protein [Candidatus Competibacter sp.]|nr:tetratricopeptide repeat protein [Candidatus Competibacter sp.]HRD50739.1 tetratricopeptide repeat protein [Candidatus Contendobacter sp.]